MLLDGDFAVRVGFDAWVVDGDDVRGSFEGGGDDGGVFGGFAGAQVEGFEASVGEPAVEGGGDGADGVLEEGQAFVDVWGVVCGCAHEDILEVGS